MGVSQYIDAMEKFAREKNIDSPATPPYKPPAGHDKELSDSERAHTGASSFKPRHGVDALGRVPKASALQDTTWQKNNFGKMK